MSFPGFLCPGLIEANSLASDLESVNFVFRGFYAPASLKRGTPIVAARAPVSFPGFLCPGLIEASWLVRSMKRRSSCFPGFLCPGLIEACVAMI